MLFSPQLSAATKAIRALGIELLAKSTKPTANAVISPFSIQSAMAMAYAGAAGQTREEMASVLHFPGNESELHHSIQVVRESIEHSTAESERQVELSKRWGGQQSPVRVSIANRIFGQAGFDFRTPFLSLLSDTYRAPLQLLDFLENSSASVKEINSWVEQQTHQRIRNLIDTLDPSTRLVLVNAIYLNAPWECQFSPTKTKLLPFFRMAGVQFDVPTMCARIPIHYAKMDGFCIGTIPYLGGDFEFVFVLPDEIDGLPAIEGKVTSETFLISKRNLIEASLYIPKFKIAPPSLHLRGVFQGMGIWAAFDNPNGSADFDRMAPRRTNDYLCLSEVIHQSFLELDEYGTEAAAATAVAARGAGVSTQRPAPTELRIDRPFLFAVEHKPSGACLFIGRVTDPTE